MITDRVGCLEQIDDGLLRGLVRLRHEVHPALHLQPRVLLGLDGRHDYPGVVCACFFFVNSYFHTTCNVSSVGG